MTVVSDDFIDLGALPSAPAKPIQFGDIPLLAASLQDPETSSILLSGSLGGDAAAIMERSDQASGGSGADEALDARPSTIEAPDLGDEATPEFELFEVGGDAYGVYSLPTASRTLSSDPVGSLAAALRAAIERLAFGDRSASQNIKRQSAEPEGAVAPANDVGDGEPASENFQATVDDHGAAANAIIGDDEANTLIGGDDADHIFGGGGDDVIEGHGGDDHLHGGGGVDKLRGGDGDDVLSGGEGSDELHGGANRDHLYGNEGDDRLFGYDYRDLLSGEGGDDEIHGGGGGDIISAGSGADLLIGGEGDDKMSGGGGQDILIGGGGDDVLEGGDGPDVFVVDGGGVETLRDFNPDQDWLAFADAGIGLDDLTIARDGLGGLTIDIAGGGSVHLEVFAEPTLNPDVFLFGFDVGEPLPDRAPASAGEDDPMISMTGGAGEDVFLGGGARDHFLGGGGDDVAFGRADQDHLQGEDGDDELHGGDGRDHLEGGLGNDRLFGGFGWDNISGDAGADLIVAGEGGGRIYGGTGADTIIGGSSRDYIYGGDGDDDIHLQGGDIVHGGAGADTFVFANGFRLDVIKDFDPVEDNLVITGVDIGLENLIFRDDPEGDGDLFVRYRVPDGVGDFRYTGYLVLEGLADVELGEGVIVFGDLDRPDRALNVEEVPVAQSPPVSSGAESGDETSQDGGATSNDHPPAADETIDHDGQPEGGGMPGDEGVQDDDGGEWAGGDSAVDAGFLETNDFLPATITGSENDDAFSGGSDADVIHGLAGDDRIKGELGDDQILGGADTDRIGGGDGADIVLGEAGDDILQGDAGDDFIFGGDGEDRLQGDLGDDRILGGAGKDRIGGGAGADQVLGGADGDILHGDAGDDFVFGGGGVDRLFGEAGDDVLVGGSAADGRRDYLDGGDGDDELNGGGGSDVLTGGAGADRFIMSGLLVIESITDFNPDEDKIVFQGVSFGFDDLTISLSDEGGLNVLFPGPGHVNLQGLAGVSLTEDAFVFA